jgi:arylsulfatase A-like enzyme
LEKVGKRLSPAEVAFLRELYRREVESVDERVGHLLRALELSGRTDQTFVVFTSDHGEGFGEHGRFLHGNSFYDELVAVPLLIAGPGVAGPLRVPDAVSLVDVMPTLRELLDVECLRPDVRGQSLAPLLAGVRDAAWRPSYLVNHSLRHRGDALVDGRHKLIAGPGRPLELYDLERDPAERHDLAARRPEVAARMAQQLRRLRRENEARRERKRALADDETLKQTSEETVEQLRALGYVE